MITLEYGTNRLMTELNGRTVGEILADPNFQAVLGLCGNEEIYVDGQRVSGDYHPEVGSVVRFMRAAQSKA